MKLKKLLLTVLLSSNVYATSTPCGIIKTLHLDNDTILDKIVCDDGEEGTEQNEFEESDYVACSCTFSHSQGNDRKYILYMEPYLGFTKYKETPKDVFVKESGYWGYAQHDYYKYEPQYQEWFSESVEHFYDTMNAETGGTGDSQELIKIRWNLDQTKLLIEDKKILKELSRVLGRTVKKGTLLDVNKEYKLTPKNIEAYNNIAYYANEYGANMAAKSMLERIVKEFPTRAVAYYTLATVYGELTQPYNEKRAYMKYVFYMTAQGKETKIPKIVKKQLGALYAMVHGLAKTYAYLTFVKWGKLEEIKSLALFAESKKGKTKLLIYRYDEKLKKYDLVGANEKLPVSYEHLSHEEKGDISILSHITFDGALWLEFSQINFHTIFRGIDNQYKFQYYDDKMKLIGAELFDYRRATGEGYRKSINYLSGKKESYEVEEMDKRVGKATWGKLKESKLIELEEFLYEVVY